MAKRKQGASMSRLINWIRSWFCSHDIKVVRGKAHRLTCGYDYYNQDILTIYCSKCGHTKQKWG